MNLFYRFLKRHKAVHKLYVKMVMSKPFLFIWAIKGLVYDFPKYYLNSVRFPSISSTDRFVVTKEFPAGGVISFSGPYSDGFDGVLLKEGTILESCSNVPGAIGFGCLPRNKEEYEKIAVPEGTRLGEKYAGYHFVILKKLIGKNLRKLGPHEIG